jgi:hypothetical protein
MKLRVYKTMKGLQKGAKALVDITGNPYKQTFENTDAGFWTAPGEVLKDKRREGLFTSSMLGIILLCEEHLEMGIIAHECAHTTFKHDKYINRFSGRYENNEDEERFCYYFEWLFLEVIKILKKEKFYIKIK